MKKDLLNILACPMCKSPLTLSATKEEGERVIGGTLQCTKCHEVYPIEDSIPNLLPPSLRTKSA